MVNQNSFDDDDGNAGNSEHLKERMHFPDAFEDMEEFFDELVREEFEERASIEHQGGDGRRT
jgi:hypothetical protein